MDGKGFVSPMARVITDYWTLTLTLSLTPALILTV